MARPHYDRRCDPRLPVLSPPQDHLGGLACGTIPSMRILLVNPPFMRLRGIPLTYFPLSVGYVGAALRRAGHEIAIYNAESAPDDELRAPMKGAELLQSHHVYIDVLKDRSHPIWREFRSVMAEVDPDVVGLTVMSCKFDSAKVLTEIARERREDVRVVWGGPHPTAMEEECFARGGADYVIPREGEVAAVKLMEHLGGELPFESASGVVGWDRERRRVVRGGPIEYEKDLDAMPFPARDALLFPERTANRVLGAVITSRGCPYDCTFCDSKVVWTRQVRNRSPENVVAEVVETYERFGQRSFNFVDDTFTLNKKRVSAICRALRQADLPINWTCTTRCDALSPEMIREMKDAGCSVVTVGIETGSERMLKEMKKGIGVADVLRASEMLDQGGLDWHAFFMIGMPRETREDIEATRRLIEQISPGRIELSVFTPYPGTEEWRVAKEMGLIEEPVDWARYSHQSDDNHFIQSIPREEFQQIRREMFELVDRHNDSLRTNFKKFRHRYTELIHNPWEFSRSVSRVLQRRFSSA